MQEEEINLFNLHLNMLLCILDVTDEYFNKFIYIIKQITLKNSQNKIN